MNDFPFYRVTWWTRTTNGQIRAYSRGVSSKADGLALIEQKRHRSNTLFLWLTCDHKRILTGERFYTDSELAKIAER